MEKLFSRRYLRFFLIPLFVVIIFWIFSFLKKTHDIPLDRYPSQPHYWKINKTTTHYRIAIIADMDQSSRQGDVWVSTMLYGTLSRREDGQYTITWDEERLLKTKLNEAGRGMELSDLCNFNNHLISFDDRTGIVYSVGGQEAIPLHILMDGNGQHSKGFKGEWCAVKDGLLYIGGMGKEFVRNGVVESYDPLWVKTLDKDFKLKHIDWRGRYDKLRSATTTEAPGYLLHEAVAWNPIDAKWFFFPRRVSQLPYDEVEDESRCGNLMISADSAFEKVNMRTVGPLNQLRGFSSVKFVPFREHEVVALKTQEKDETVSFITVLDVKSGKVLLPETKIRNVKFEGVEFL